MKAAPAKAGDKFPMTVSLLRMNEGYERTDWYLHEAIVSFAMVDESAVRRGGGAVVVVIR